ncbi:MAG: DoxX family protein [Bacteroidetes bacterium]|jgi:uncharacterized membrane protein YphA (DoxX/SURF4 family)|nr:DoxX family protein [Bacteroidota bacterium]MBT6684947.1 DoxX family protein [Bacteroidota bacterium]MBT7145252.1 DoxX family protein [Bacteroidota bacterium]MBT7493023.1 DoxX family protein [Bacteroidota bacterium]
MIKIIPHVLRTVVGLVFLYSAYAKLFPIEYFELFVFENGIPNWHFATVFARLIISTEFFIGLILIINIFSKQILRLNLILLAAFTFVLIYFAIFSAEMTNCNCFGEYLKLSPIESIFKNFILIGATIFLIFYNTEWNFKFQKLISIVVFIATFSVPTILTPPDFVYPQKMQVLENRTLNTEYFQDFKNNPDNLKIDNSKALVCFYSLKCKFCKMAAKKISIIDNNLENDLPIFYIFYGKEENIESFWTESESKKYPYTFIPMIDFFSQSGKQLPAIYYVEDGKMIGKVGYRGIDQNDVIEFFGD